MDGWWNQFFPTGQQSLKIQDALDRQIEIAYGETGSGKPIFLLHGIGSWSYNWQHNIQPLSQYYRVICVDAKGYGFSQAPPPPETVGHQVAELAQIIQALADLPVTLVAESLGALTALAVAQTSPSLIERLVLINVPIFPQKLPSWGMQGLSFLPLSLVHWVDQGRLLPVFAPLLRALFRSVRQEVVFDPTQVIEADLDALIYPYLKFPGRLTQFVADLQLAAAEINKVHHHQPNWISTIQQNLDQVICPTLILWSDCDRWFPVADGERLHHQLPNAQFQVIPNCGHVASSGNPSAVNAAILDFLMANSWG